MIRYTKDNPNMIRRRSEIKHKKTAPGKKARRDLLQDPAISFRCSFFAYKKGGPGISPWHMKKKKVYLSKKGNCLCLIITIPWICEKSVLKFQKNCEEVLNKQKSFLT